jgi:His/Glu/Gln/Arg/opine family amino acid ABC transporter permease subunit
VTAALGTPRVPLWRDVRVLKWVAQIVVVGIVVAIVMWLYGNYVDNSSRQNIPTDLGFLDNPAAFQITGNPLSQSAPVRDALYQGFLNTLRIAVAGIIAATVLGTLVGIARLSKNWIVARMATVYVEVVRNVPLALFVVAAFSVVVLGVFPQIQDSWTPIGAELSPRGQQTLERVAARLKEFNDRRFIVAGHTDNEPIAKTSFIDNWELSTTRALVVTRFLIAQGLTPNHLVAAGYGEFDPVKSNKTPGGRLRNRRIELILEPKIPDVSKLLKNIQTEDEDGAAEARPARKGAKKGKR